MVWYTNGRPYDGICTCGYGADYQYHHAGDVSHLMSKERVDQNGQSEILTEGWAIVWGPGTCKPGYVEMDYFGIEDFHDRDTINTPEEWCEAYRPGCKFVRVQVVEETNG